MRPGDSIDIHRYHFVFNGVRNIVGPNWTGGEGIIAVTRNGRPEATLYAEKRFYTASRMMMTEAAISGGLTPRSVRRARGRAERRQLGGASVL
ncbi:cytochrome c heme lyase subunit CcmF [Klebsiella pneumoniae]|uniref:Cytochrome c heme lyase subunit CcmF n=1 Tax=Klebsiella pneumoniae TaxID=573 RepID=A0A3S4KN31_KLEPN|nr:cytochrome c heme lyase subunit CcmF [Klebsiella pneumoniae]